MDDDDYYPANRVESVVNAFNKYPKVDLAGSSEMHMYYTNLKKIYTIGPFSPNHATNGTMAWTKRYSDTHKYDEYVTKTEETSFLDNYKNQMIQLDPLSTILVICHSDNTVDKNELREEHAAINSNLKGKLRPSAYKLEKIVKEPHIRNFYLSL